VFSELVPNVDHRYMAGTFLIIVVCFWILMNLAALTWFMLRVHRLHYIRSMILYW